VVGNVRTATGVSRNVDVETNNLRFTNTPSAWFTATNNASVDITVTVRGTGNQVLGTFGDVRSIQITDAMRGQNIRIEAVASIAGGNSVTARAYFNGRNTLASVSIPFNVAPPTIPFHFQRTDGADPQMVFRQMNAWRAEHGLPPFVWNQAFANSAQSHAEWLLDVNNTALCHASRNAGQCGPVVPPAGSMGQIASQGNRPVYSWAHSTRGHNAIMLSTRSPAVGIGMACDSRGRCVAYAFIGGR
jgi:uncharacterized protein YkwD